ncbi:serine/threonine protein kinase [Rhodococcus sp. 14C212]|uniref:serine/threonine protein kinase n=1 Tax=Rhodococcus sp. 14C212 TaxID=2711209 RepID=UPI001980D0E5|nr:serine/threonine protein kinase [Rhodococcus sp. 14C212]
MSHPALMPDVRRRARRTSGAGRPSLGHREPVVTTLWKRNLDRLSAIKNSTNETASDVLGVAITIGLRHLDLLPAGFQAYELDTIVDCSGGLAEELGIEDGAERRKVWTRLPVAYRSTIDQLVDDYSTNRVALLGALAAVGFGHMDEFDSALTYMRQAALSTTEGRSLTMAS